MRRFPTDDPHVRRPDTTLAEQLLGWAPEVALRDGLTRTIADAGVQTLIGAGVR
jgi:dTDP-glucose 4,6-dehydratase